MSKRRKLAKLAASAGVLGSLASQQAAADVVAPAGLNPGDKFNLVFLSTGTIDATSADPTAYDALVAGEAAANGLGMYAGSPVTWQTLGSFNGLDGPAAFARFNPASPIYTLDGDLVAGGGNDLFDGTIANPINVRANLSVATSGSVWTGSNALGGPANIKLGDNGTPNFPFDDPIMDTSIGATIVRIGDPTATTAVWIDASADVANTSANFLYAFSNELTVPSAVPESPWIGAAGAAAVAVAAWFRKR